MKRSPGAVEQIAAGAAQAFLEHGAGHARMRAGEQARRMELHHLHVAQRQPRAQRHRETIAALVAGRACGTCTSSDRRRSRAAPPSPARRRTRRCACRPAARRRARRRRRVCIKSSARCSSSRRDAARPDLLGQPVDDLDAGEVALVHRAVERLAGERLLVDRAVGIAIEEAAELVLQLVDALDRAGDERPREILVGQPLAAFDRVHEMALDRIAGGKRDVVAALDHARAAAFAEQSLDRDRDRQRRDRPACACSAANSPAPPAPRIRMSVSTRRTS